MLLHIVAHVVSYESQIVTSEVLHVACFCQQIKKKYLVTPSYLELYIGSKMDI